MEACGTGGNVEGAAFEELHEEMQTDPCCPAPDAEGAAKMLDRLKLDVAARDDLSAAEQEALCAIIDARREWYPTSGLCKH